MSKVKISIELIEEDNSNSVTVEREFKDRNFITFTELLTSFSDASKGLSYSLREDFTDLVEKYQTEDLAL